jgi:CheY-like chemotaxis protein
MTKRTILVVDDDQMVLSIIYDYLSELGYEVLTAADVKGGTEAFRRAAPRAFRSRVEDMDLVMIDVRIGRESGFTLADILEDQFRCLSHRLLLGRENPGRIAQTGKALF